MINAEPRLDWCCIHMDHSHPPHSLAQFNFFCLRFRCFVIIFVLELYMDCRDAVGVVLYGIAAKNNGKSHEKEKQEEGKRSEMIFLFFNIFHSFCFPCRIWGNNRRAVQCIYTAYIQHKHTTYSIENVSFLSSSTNTNTVEGRVRDRLILLMLMMILYCCNDFPCYFSSFSDYVFPFFSFLPFLLMQFIILFYILKRTERLRTTSEQNRIE